MAEPRYQDPQGTIPAPRQPTLSGYHNLTFGMGLGHLGLQDSKDPLNRPVLTLYLPNSCCTELSGKAGVGV